MTDSPVATMVRSAGKYIHFQEYWVRCKGSIPVEEVKTLPGIPTSSHTGRDPGNC